MCGGFVLMKIPLFYSVVLKKLSYIVMFGNYFNFLSLSISIFRFSHIL